MAIRQSDTLFCTNNTDADFRAWVQFIEDTFVTTGGWAVTADTGQMTISTATKPGAANTKVGYRIYKMTDDLAATFPCFVKVYYGSGSQALNPGFWIVVGQGSDGTGGITGTLFDDSAATSPTCATNANSTTQVTNSYGSAQNASAGGRITLALFTNPTQIGHFMVWGIERTKNSSTGVDNGTGFIMMWSTAGGGMNRSKWLEPALGGTAAQPATETGCACILTSNTVTLGSLAFGDNVLASPFIPIKATGQFPGYNFVAVPVNSMISVSTFRVARNTFVIGYKVVSSSSNVYPIAQPGSGTTLNNMHVAMRYD